ncbi:cysteine hydrolase family protein [Chitinimonas sp. PSY-7]|uniref:isochorismatase family protein n=1 Tax=Chitinimonas sp. PSY-7 TaxID=3459088 RepID=UPI00403FEC4C
MTRALLVIDVQESFRYLPCWQNNDLPDFLVAQNKLIRGASTAGIPVVRIYHVHIHEHNQASEKFRHSSGYIVALAGSDPAADHIVFKQTHSALADTGLRTWLRAQGINRVIISGIRTEQSCEATARHASDIGFAVDFITEATLTFPMRHSNGRHFSPAEIKERTELVLAGGIARILSVDEVLAEWPVLA